MKKSEIFDSFVKIAQEKGMISNDSSEAKKKLENTGRAGSDDVSTIEALYGVKPDSTKGMDYKSNIMEIAHPNSVVVSPSYDKLNGLVENNIERQNILLNIVNSPVSGHSTQKKYAETELLVSLVRIGNELDNVDQDELRALADFCLAQTSNMQIKKNAVAPIAVGAVAAVAALLGGIYLKNHMRFISDGLEQDHAKLMGEIDDLLTSNSNWGVGTQYKQSFTQMMQSFKGKLEAFHNVYKQIQPIIDDLDEPRDAKELMAKAKSGEADRVKSALDAFQKAADFILPEVIKIIGDGKKIKGVFRDESYKQRQVQDKGWMTSLVDATQVLSGGKGLFADNMDDVVHALETYMMDIQNIRSKLAEAGTIQTQVQNELSAASSKSQEMFGGPVASLDNSPNGQKTLEDHDKEADDLMKELSSFQK